MHKYITIIHDLAPEEFKKQFPAQGENWKIISKENSIAQCIGCFGCWVKTPSKCIIQDEFQHIGKIFMKSEKIIVITRCTYGGYSPFVKNVFDRCIGCLLPFFTTRNGEVHHPTRSDNRPIISAHFYGNDITDKEKETARKLIPANALNIIAASHSLQFYKHSEEIEEVI
ncbi:MAG: NAD(P)H-dependent oxidoreductase [Oscillospiraceae bacterium]|nr:NAD(P)H-dependent oxidoreductase [Oscillospiraceae bacterium]